MKTLLRDNIQELYYASNAPSGRIAIIANWSGKRLYYANQGWGRMWRWIYRIAEWVSGQDRRLEKVKSAVINTQILFQQQIAILLQALNKYQEYLKKVSNEYQVNEKDYFDAREKIRKWTSSTAPFVKMMQQSLNPSLKRLLSCCFGDELTSEQLAALFAPPPKPILKACKRIIDLEGISQGPLPLAVFKKVFRGKVLNAIDNKVLDRWIRKIDKTAKAPQYVHQGISAIAVLNKRKKNGVERPLNPCLLEKLLEDRGCKVFEKEDPRHLTWRSQLKEGDKLPFKKDEIILGKEINPSPADLDYNRVFSIANKPEEVALIGHNQAVLGIRFLRQPTGNDFDIESAQIQDVSEDGRIALMDRLLPLNMNKWNSTGVELSPEDAISVKPLIEMLKKFVSKNITPSNFNPNSLMLDKQFRLKSLKQMKNGPFDFNALEEFAKQWAAGNMTVFKHLMHDSGLSKHYTAKFYYESIKNALKGDTTAPEDLGGIFKINDPSVIERSDALVRDVRILQQKILMQARELYPSANPKTLNNAIASAIIMSHAASGVVSVLLPGIDQDVLEFLSNNKALLTRKS